jgi:flagellar biosynthesis/type III secretory pathway ATPase
VDDAIDRIDSITEFLKQDVDEKATLDETVALMPALVGGP